jgi:hypothetical protein
MKPLVLVSLPCVGLGWRCIGFVWSFAGFGGLFLLIFKVRVGPNRQQMCIDFSSLTPLIPNYKGF